MISAVASKASSSASSSYDAKPMDLEACAKRIQELIKELNLNINNKKLERINCPISMDVPKEPVVTNCGHIFEKSALQRVINAKQPCPDCRANIVTISPVHALKGMIEEEQKQEPVPFLSCKNENKELAEFYIGIANQCIKLEQYEMALTNLSQALLHTKAVEDYAKLPPVYEKLKEWKKATLAYLRLALYQLQAGKEAITTLEHCKELSPELKIDTVLMALDPSPTRVAKAIQRAPKQDHEEAIAIYKQVILYSPRALSAYEALIPLLKDPTEKKEYLLKAAECATRVGKPELAEKFREMAGKRTSITLKEWANPRLLLDKIERDSPRFKRLEEFMKGPCPIWRGKTARETHGFALRFQNFIITEDGSSVEVPRTLEGLDQCDKASNGHGFSTLWQKIEHLRPTSFEEEEYEFIVFTMDVLPGSLGMDYASQKELVESKGYEVPSIIDAATYILWESRLSRTALFASLYTRCRENINGSQLVLGHFSHRGLSVDFSLCNSKLDCYGMAGFLKF